MKYLLVIFLAVLICFAHCKIEIEEVDEFEEFEESSKTDNNLKTKDDSSPVVDKVEAEVTVEVYLISRFMKQIFTSN